MYNRWAWFLQSGAFVGGALLASCSTATSSAPVASQFSERAAQEAAAPVREARVMATASAAGSEFAFVTMANTFDGYEGPFQAGITQPIYKNVGSGGPTQDAAGDVFIGAAGMVYELAPPYTGKMIMLPHTGLQDYFIDSNQNFIATVTDGIVTCPPPYKTCTTQSTTQGWGADGAYVAAKNNDVLSYTPALRYLKSAARLVVYAPPYTNPPAATIPLDLTSKAVSSILGAFAADANSDFFVGYTDPENNTGQVREFAPPYNGPAIAIRRQLPDVIRGMAADSNGDLFVSGGTKVVEYAPPFGEDSAPVATINLSKPEGIAVDNQGNLFVTDYNLNQVFIYAPPYSGPAIERITRAVQQPELVFITQPT